MFTFPHKKGDLSFLKWSLGIIKAFKKIYQRVGKMGIIAFHPAVFLKGVPTKKLYRGIGSYCKGIEMIGFNLANKSVACVTYSPIYLACSKVTQDSVVNSKKLFIGS